MNVWVREMHEKRQEKAAKKKAHKERKIAAAPVVDKQLPEDVVMCLDDEDFAFEDPGDCLNSRDIHQEDQMMLRRQEQFRIAAGYIADSLSDIPEVQKVVLFGSVAKPLKKEVPRFHRFRRAGISINHECQDVDIAVWVSDLNCLKAIQKARSLVLNELLADKQIGVAHHQVDIFIMEPETDCYLGRLCTFGTCPRIKNKCTVTGCGEIKFLRQHEDFKFNSRDLDEEISIVLFERDLK